jgi:signal transduction histidine kinase
VQGSAALLEAALEAVLRNAVEAMPAGGTVTLRVEEAGGQGWLRVRDSGPGLSAAERARLFEPFWTTKTGRHLGLGLVMARELMQAQGGALTVEPGSGVGLTVTLSLPALAPDLPARAEGARHALSGPHLCAAHPRFVV